MAEIRVIWVDPCKCPESLEILGAVNFFSVFFNPMLDEMEGGGYDGCMAAPNEAAQHGERP